MVILDPTPSPSSTGHRRAPEDPSTASRDLIFVTRTHVADKEDGVMGHGVRTIVKKLRLGMDANVEL